jgi:hypothetical protein
VACRLAGVPIPRRATAPNQRAADSDGEAERKSESINGPASGAKKLSINLNSTETAAAPVKPTPQAKRPAEEQLESTLNKKAALKSEMAGKQPRVEDTVEEDKQTARRTLASPTTKKRVAFVDPAFLREDEDGRTKRCKHDTEDQEGLSGLDTATTAESTLRQHASATQHKEDNLRHDGICSSCLDMHPKHDMLQLTCKDEGDRENHAYCRDCLQRLFESSVTDPSHFPPRCCSKIIPLFSCTPFLPQPLIARFVERREELGTVNRTYCSNTKCSKWIRPANIEANVASCTECFQKTCATCKSKEHTGLCLEDKDVKELMSVARQKRWQTCPSCKEMVELERGCYHIT